MDIGLKTSEPDRPPRKQRRLGARHSRAHESNDYLDAIAALQEFCTARRIPLKFAMRSAIGLWLKEYRTLTAAQAEELPAIACPPIVNPGRDQ